MRYVIVLGCGPAGLLAAHAVRLAGHTPVIYSTKTKSKIAGAQYLHAAIDRLTPRSPEAWARFVKIGTAEGYARKVYGDPKRTTSWKRWEEDYYPTWNLGAVYDKLWDMYSAFIKNIEVTTDLLDVMEGPVISTIPAPVLCNGKHSFEKSETWIARGVLGLQPHTVVYNGDPEFGWHRASHLYGHEWVEYSKPILGAQKITKPQDTTCKCRKDIHRVGRYGLWKRDQLVSDAFEQARAICEVL